jgi:hypothetical protein
MNNSRWMAVVVWLTLSPGFLAVWGADVAMGFDLPRETRVLVKVDSFYCINRDMKGKVYATREPHPMNVVFGCKVWLNWRTNRASPEPECDSLIPMQFCTREECEAWVENFKRSTPDYMMNGVQVTFACATQDAEGDGWDFNNDQD